MNNILRFILGFTFLVSITLNVRAQAVHFFPFQKDSLVFVDSTGLIYEVLRDSVGVDGAATIHYLHPEIEMYASQMSLCVGSPYGNSMLGRRIISFTDRSYLVFDADSIAIPYIQNVPLLSVFRGDSLTIELVSKTLDTTNQIPDTVYNYTIVPIGLISIGQCLNASALKISKTRGVIAFPGCFKYYLSRSVGSTYFEPGQLVASKIQRISNQDYGPFPIGTQIHYISYDYWGPSNYTEKYVNDLLVSTQPASIRRYVYEITNKGPLGFTYRYDTLMVNSFYMLHASPQIGDFLSYRIIDSTLSGTNFMERIHEDKNGGLPSFTLTTTTPMLDTCLLPLIGDWSYYLDQYAKIIGQISMSHWESTQGYTTGWSRNVLYFTNGTTTWGTPHAISISEFEQEKAIKIFPVPAINNISVEGLPETEHSFSWKIYDVNARTLKAGETLISDSFIDVSELSTGLYILEINGSMIFKIVKN